MVFSQAKRVLSEDVDFSMLGIRTALQLQPSARGCCPLAGEGTIDKTRRTTAIEWTLFLMILPLTMFGLTLGVRRG
jgi:hypothetical protein